MPLAVVRFVKGLALTSEDTSVAAKKRWQSAGGVTRKARMISDLRANSQKMRASKSLAAAAVVVLTGEPVASENAATPAERAGRPQQGCARRKLSSVVVPKLKSEQVQKKENEVQ